MFPVSDLTSLSAGECEASEYAGKEVGTEVYIKLSRGVAFFFQKIKMTLKIHTKNTPSFIVCFFFFLFKADPHRNSRDKS